MTRRLLPRLLACAVIGILLLVGLPAAPAQADVTVAVELTELRVPGTRPSDQVVLTGRVTNNGAQPAFGVHVVLWRSKDPIRDPAVLDAVASGGTTPWGERLAAKPDHYFKITSSTESLDPGKSADFVVRATLADLGLTAKGAAYAFGVQVLGTADASSNYVSIGRARTLLTLPGTDPVPLTTVILLNSAPSKLRAGVFADDHLAAELAGRLEALLTAAERPGNSWLIDPSLYDEVTEMAAGYQVQDDDQLLPGTGQPIATAWLARFRELPQANGGRTLFGNPDVLGASRAQDHQVLGRALAAGKTVEDLDDLPLVVVPRDGLADESLIDWLAAAGADAVLTSTAGEGAVFVRSPAKTPLLRTTAVNAVTDSEPGRLLEANRLLAEVAVNQGQLRLITSLAELSTSEAAHPRWLAARTLGALLADDPARPAATLTLPAKVTTVSSARVREVGALGADYSAYADLVPDSTLAAGAPAALSRALSWSWAKPADSRAYLDDLQELVGREAVTDRVQLDASSRVVMSSRSNEFPVTVTNELTEPIRIRVLIESDNPQRLSVPASALITVAPGQSQTVNVRPEATSNGLVNVTAFVATEDGRRVTPPRRITVDVTDLGMIGWIIVVTSGIVLIAATAWRIRQVRRTAAKESA